MGQRVLVGVRPTLVALALAAWLGHVAARPAAACHYLHDTYYVPPTPQWQVQGYAFERNAAAQAARQLPALSARLGIPTFQTVGVARADDPGRLLWIVDQRLLTPNLYVVGDHYLAAVEPYFHADEGAAAAVRLFRDGEPVRTYTVPELVAQPGAMPQRVSESPLCRAAFHRWLESAELDAATGRLALRPFGVGGPVEPYVFDLRQGGLAVGDVTEIGRLRSGAVPLAATSPVAFLALVGGGMAAWALGLWGIGRALRAPRPPRRTPTPRAPAAPRTLARPLY